MACKASILGAILALGMGMTGSALAAGSDLVDGNDVKAILELARGYGDADIEKHNYALAA